MRLDIHQVEAIAAQVAVATGIDPGATTVAIDPETTIQGTLGGRPVEDRFAPELRFQLLPLQLQAPAADDLAPEVAGALTTTKEVPRHFTVTGRSVRVSTARALAVGIGAPALLAAAVGVVVLRRRLRREVARIELRHGHRMVLVSGRLEGADVVEVHSIQVLARLAEQSQSLVLHRQGDDEHHYELTGDGVVYRYRTHGERPTPGLAGPGAALLVTLTLESHESA